MQKKLTTRGPVTAAGGPQKAWASHETDGVCPGSRRTSRFGRSTWASALFSRAIGQRATKETRRALFAVVVWGGSDETHGYRPLEVPGGREHHTRTTGRVRCLFGLRFLAVGGGRVARSPGRHGTKDPPARCLWSSCGGVGNEADQHGLPLVVPERRWNHMRPRRRGRGYVGPAISGGRRGHRHVFHARMGGVRQKRPASALFAVVVPIMRAFFYYRVTIHTHPRRAAHPP